MRNLESFEARVFAKIDASGPCWLWTAATTREGYGVVGRGARVEGLVYAHRAVWELLVSLIPTGLELDHLCRVRRCVNPDHLEMVTRSLNMARGGRWPASGRCTQIRLASLASTGFMENHS